MKNLLPKRSENTHKGSYGRVVIIAGSRGMTGAPYLASKSALRAGTGLVYCLIPEILEYIMSIKLTEVIIKPIFDRSTGHFVKESIDSILDEIENVDAIALGPGMGVGGERVELVSKIIEKSNVPMVIDADGINCISKYPEMLNHKKSPVILTPHSGEIARLLKKDIKEIESNRKYYSQYISEKYDVFVVLKGHNTIVTSSQGELYINNTGNPGMATAGSGDVLTGIIASLLGQNLSPFDAAKLGVYLHGLSGDIAKDQRGEFGIIATDILEAIPYAILKMKS